MQLSRLLILLVSLIVLENIKIDPVLANEQDNFAKLVADPSEQQLVLNAAKQAAVVFNSPCPSASFTVVNQFAIYEPLKFNPSGKISGGAWKQTVAEKGCGRERILPVLVYFDEQNNSLQATPLLPGGTHADPILQRDAIMYASIAATTSKNTDCNNTYVEDTQFLKEKGEALPGAKGRPWDELWTMNVCGTKAQVTMHFIPDKTGTTINASPQETKF